MSALEGYRVLELASERVAFAGKLLADMGADVILIEPPGGDPSRGYPPFVDDEPGVDRSLWWWHYHTSKRGIVLDLDRPEDRGRLSALAAGADILVAGAFGHPRLQEFIFGGSTRTFLQAQGPSLFLSH